MDSAFQSNGAMRSSETSFVGQRIRQDQGPAITLHQTLLEGLHEIVLGCTQQSKCLQVVVRPTSAIESNE